MRKPHVHLPKLAGILPRETDEVTERFVKKK